MTSGIPAIITKSAAMLAIAATVPLAAQAGVAPRTTPCAKWGDKTARALTAPQERQAIQCLLNVERRRAGLPLLRRSAILEGTARRHDVRMPGRCFAHRCGSEASVAGRIRAAGARAPLGENIAYGTDVLSTPRAIVEAWMEHAHHRANILRPSFRLVGVWVSTGTPTDHDPSGTMVTTDFAAR